MAMRLVRAHLFHPRRGVRTARVLVAYRRAQEDLRSGPWSEDLAAAQLGRASDRTGVARDVVAQYVTRWMGRVPLDLLPRFAPPDLRQSLEELRRQGVRLAALSDYAPESKLEALGIADLFDVVLCAQDPDVGVFKPNPRGLRVALARLGVTAEQTLYVGDRAEVDAAAADAAGMPCVILTDRTVRTYDGGVRRVASLREITYRRELT